MVKVIIAGKTRHDRKVQRRQLGSLRTNTVAPRTRARYDTALQSFYQYCQSHKVRIPDEGSQLDDVVADYIEFLWEEGEGLSRATDTISGLQDLKPRLRGQLSLSWRLVKTWQRKEIPLRAPPFPETLLHALCGYFLMSGEPLMALALEVAFYGVLRTGELLSLSSHQVEVAPNDACAVLNLGLTKTSQRTGAQDSVTIRVLHVCQQLRKWKQSMPLKTPLVTVSDYLFRKSFDQGLHALGLSTGGFRPYSLRRGGATMYFTKNPSMDWLRLMGRWSSDRTVRVYVNDGLARLAEMHYDVSKPPLRAYFSSYLAQFSRRVATSRGRGG